MRTKVYCKECERHEVVCECVNNDDRENACFEQEQAEQCEHNEEVK
jgi:hypothetical protein